MSKRFTLQVIKNGQIKLTVPNCEISERGYPQHCVSTMPDYECDPDARSEETGEKRVFVSRAACEAAGLDPKLVQQQTLHSVPEHLEKCLPRMGLNPDGNNLVNWQEKEAAEKAAWEAANPEIAAEARRRAALPQPYRFTCPDCGEKVWSGTSCWETGLRHPGPDGSHMPEPLSDAERREAALENAVEDGRLPGASPADI